MNQILSLKTNDVVLAIKAENNVPALKQFIEEDKLMWLRSINIPDNIIPLTEVHKILGIIVEHRISYKLLDQEKNSSKLIRGVVMSLPLFSYQSTVALVDDDELFLKAFTRVLNKNYHLKTFRHVQDTLDFLKTYTPFLSPSSLLKGCSDHENYDTIEHMPVDLNNALLTELRNCKKRNQDISVIIIDYHMPNMNGLELCRKLKDLPVKKILLTGNVDHPEAVAAFNEGLIDRFVRKDHPQLIDEIKLHIDSLTKQYFSEITGGLLSHLEVDFSLPVSDSEFADFFRTWCHENNMREYYLMDKQGNFIAIDDKNNSFYFIVHTDRTLSSFVDLHRDDETVAEYINAVSERKLIPFFGLGKEPWQIEESDWHTCFYPPEIFQGKENYFWAVIERSNLGV